jgi:hypothetical protein
MIWILITIGVLAAVAFLAWYANKQIERGGKGWR